jgi:Beta-lactamase
VLASGPPQPFEILGTMPAGGSTSTGTDMARFMIAHLQEGRFDTVRILRPETARLMHSSAHSPATPDGIAGISLAFMEGSEPRRRSIGHGGDTYAFHAGLVLYLDAQVGVFVAVNSQGAGVLDGNGVVSATIDGFANRFLPLSLEPTAPAVPTAADHAAMAAGPYLSSRHFERSFLSLLNLRHEQVHANPDGTITIESLTDALGKPKQWREVAPWIWQETAGSDRLAVTIEGPHVRMIRRSEDPATVLLRADGLRNASWNGPLLLMTIGVLLGEVVRQLVRRGLRIVRPATPSPTASSRLERVALLGLLAATVTIAGWLFLVYGLFSGDVGLLSATRDPMLRSLQVTGAMATLLCPAILIAKAAALRHANPRFRSKLWSICVMIAGIGFVWFAVAFHLLGPSLMY